jgi:hypothetical protein
MPRNVPDCGRGDAAAEFVTRLARSSQQAAKTLTPANPSLASTQRVTVNELVPAAFVRTWSSSQWRPDNESETDRGTEALPPGSDALLGQISGLGPTDTRDVDPATAPKAPTVR